MRSRGLLEDGLYRAKHGSSYLLGSRPKPRHDLPSVVGQSRAQIQAVECPNPSLHSATARICTHTRLSTVWAGTRKQSEEHEEVSAEQTRPSHCDILSLSALLQGRNGAKSFDYRRAQGSGAPSHAGGGSIAEGRRRQAENSKSPPLTLWEFCRGRTYIAQFD